jgi:hypothetical protein
VGRREDDRLTQAPALATRAGPNLGHPSTEDAVGIVLINQSSLISDADVTDIANACDHQLRNDVSTAWNISKPLTVTTTPDKSA